MVKLARERKEFVKKVAELAEAKVLSLIATNPDILKEELETKKKLRVLLKDELYALLKA